MSMPSSPGDLVPTKWSDLPLRLLTTFIGAPLALAVV